MKIIDLNSLRSDAEMEFRPINLKIIPGEFSDVDKFDFEWEAKNMN